MLIGVNKWIMILNYMRKYGHKINVIDISRALTITYSHTHRILIALKKKRFVSSEKSGRQRFYCLTEKGEKIAEHCKEIMKVVNGMQKT